MGQKVHPIGIRLGIVKEHTSVWYADGRTYADYLFADLKVREYLQDKLKSASVSRIDIHRPAQTARITIHTARPGIVIGKKGAEIAVLKKELEHLSSARDALLGAAMYFMEVGQKDPMTPLTNATPFLELMGEVTVGWLLLEQATIAYPKLVEVCKGAGVDLADPEALAKLCEDNVDAKFYDGKVKVAKFWANRVLAVAAAEAEVIKSGDRTVLEATL